MPVDRKALMKKMRDAKADQGRVAKQIMYPLPDLRGPGGNAYALLGQAAQLMKQAGLPDTAYDEFKTEATKDDYDHLLKTIQGWFTVAVQDTTYIPIGDGVDILSLRPNEDGAMSWEDVDPDISPELKGALEEYEENADEARRVADVQDRINKEVRQELGLSDDEVVIVQIKRTKKKG